MLGCKVSGGFVLKVSSTISVTGVGFLSHGSRRGFILVAARTLSISNCASFLLLTDTWYFFPGDCV